MDTNRHKIEVLQLKIRYTKNVIIRLRCLQSILKAQKETDGVILKYSPLPNLSAANRQWMEVAERIRQTEESLTKLQTSWIY
jgi:hypothetical protein